MAPPVEGEVLLPPLGKDPGGIQSGPWAGVWSTPVCLRLPAPYFNLSFGSGLGNWGGGWSAVFWSREVASPVLSRGASYLNPCTFLQEECF